jgi:hypothetical protein
MFVVSATIAPVRHSHDHRRAELAALTWKKDARMGLFARSCGARFKSWNLLTRNSATVIDHIVGKGSMPPNFFLISLDAMAKG